MRELYPLVVADIALLTVDQGVLKALLVKRTEMPEKGRWALPGGILRPDLDSSVRSAAARVLKTKLGVVVPSIEEVCSFSGRDRDPRGWSIGMLYLALLPANSISTVINNSIEKAAWLDVENVPELAFDHGEQLSQAVLKIRDKVERHKLPLHLLSETFTISELQSVCEAVLGRRLDKSVFRRRLKASTDLVQTDQKEDDVTRRPASLYMKSNDFVF